jgi:Flp pilus assembly pilin Flp
MALTRRLREQDGQAAIDYAMIAVLVSVVLIGVITALGIGVQGLFQSLVDVFP